MLADLRANWFIISCENIRSALYSYQVNGEVFNYLVALRSIFTFVRTEQKSSFILKYYIYFTAIAGRLLLYFVLFHSYQFMNIDWVESFSVQIV